MRKMLLLAYSKIRGEKGQTVSFMLIMTIAITLLSLGTLTLFNFGDALEKSAEKLNTENASLLVGADNYSAQLDDEIKALVGVADFEICDVISAPVSFDYSEGIMTNQGVIMKSSDERRIGKIEMLEIAETIPENPIYIPYIVCSGGGYTIGDEFKLKVGTKEFDYTVAGYFENTFLASTNAYSIGMLLDDTEYAELAEAVDSRFYAKHIKLITLDDTDDAKLAATLSTLAKKYAPEAQTFTNYREGVMISRSFTASMCSAILVALAMIVLIICVVVLSFRIQNSIDEGIQGIGALKSLGYTSRQIICGNITQFSILSLLSILLGIALSYVSLPLISGIFAKQTGIIWHQGFDIVTTVLVLGIILGVTIISTLISSRRINKLDAIDALRGGIVSHNFKRNVIPLESSHGSVGFLLAMKSALQSIRSNIQVALIIAACTFCTLFSLSMYTHISLDTEGFVEVLAGEIPDIAVYTAENVDCEKLTADINQVDGVSRAYIYGNVIMSLGSNTIYTYITEDFNSVRSDLSYEGRNPLHDNEIAINGVCAEKLGYKIGDTLSVELGSGKENYLLVGLISSSNNYGMDAEMTLAGAKRLNSAINVASVFVNVEEGVDISETADTLESLYGDSFRQIFNFYDRINSQLDIYLTLNNSMLVSIISVVFVVVLLIFYLVIKTTVNRKKRSLGIEKTIGFTTMQLTTQIALAYVPVSVVGTALGGLLGQLFTNTVINAVFKMLGIMKLDFQLPLMMTIISCLVICAVSFLISLVISLRTKRISAYSLIRDV